MKIYTLDQIGGISQILKNEGKTIVQCHGVFDLLHVGHLRHFQEAKKYGLLFVTVTCDKYVGKGKNRPIINQHHRAEMIAALSCVDYVCISEYQTARHTIEIIRPDFFCKGIDYGDENMSVDEKFSIESVGARLLYTSTEKFSTTEIIERCKNA